MLHNVKLYADPCDLLKLATRGARQVPSVDFVNAIAADGVKEPIPITVLLSADGRETWTVNDGIQRIMAAIATGQRYVPITQEIGLCQ